MGCRICGDARTVRSHIIPKAFAHLVRNGEKSVITGSRYQIGIRHSQGGTFNNDLLCRVHEGMTAAPDKYAIEFVRRVQAARSAPRNGVTLQIANPAPQMLRSFALLTIWREVHSCNRPSLTLGAHDASIRRHLFEGAPAPDWALIVQRTHFIVADDGGIDFNTYPYRVRLLDRTAWLFAVAGVAFLTISDNRGLPPLFADWRADSHDPCPVPAADPLPITDVRSFRAVFTAMRARPTGL